MAWPARAKLWGHRIGDARREHAACANAFAAFEPAMMLASSGGGPHCITQQVPSAVGMSRLDGPVPGAPTG